MKIKRLKKFNIGLLFIVMFLTILPATHIIADDMESTKLNTQTKATPNDEVLDEVIKQRIDDNTKAGGYTGSWQEYLDQEYRKVASNFNWKKEIGLSQWSGDSASETKGDPSTDPMTIPHLSKDDFVEVYYGEQLAYALTDTSINKNIRIMNDIDLAGYDKAWTVSVAVENVAIDGNNKIIYNLGAQKSFIDTMKTSEMYNITFDSAKLVSASANMLGIVGKTSVQGDAVSRSSLSHVRVQNSLIFSAYPTYDFMQGYAYAAPIAESKNLKADYVASVNNTVYAVAAHTSGAFGVVEHSEIVNSYSIDSTIIAGGNHSGGFISCSDGEMDIQKSFTNNTVYGNKSTGVFIGAIKPNYVSTDKTANFENCFTSGTIEGTNQLGGFIGLIEDNGGIRLKVKFKNCYSTSIVGMRQGGKNLGGFLGGIQNQGGMPYSFINCYAAGEVGAIDTDVRTGRGESSIGGFIGSFSLASNNVFTNCFYDKQTTAMREWATGDTSGTSLAEQGDKEPKDAGSLDYLDNDNPGTNNIDGIRGVLTSDSKKFGAGLASLPNANPSLPAGMEKVGFIGFEGDADKGSGIISNDDWIYDGGNTNPNAHNCMYPQLSVFYNSDDTLVRAYSYASASTVHEQVWDHCTYEGSLARSTYDTVRDLTTRFTLTSYVDNTDKDNAVNITWKKSDANSKLYGKDQQVIGAFGKIKSTKYGREYWTADKFAPGTEWVSVNFEVKGEDGKVVVGNRRLRIIPTSNIDAGNDHLDVAVGTTYNHAKDAYFAYSTAPRMAADLTDITTGVYPDEFPFTSDDPRYDLQKSQTISGKSIKDLFDLYNDKYQVSAEFMSDVAEGIEKPHKDNIINTYVYDVKKFSEITGQNTAEIIYMEDGKTKDESAILSPTLIKQGNKSALEWAEKFNGTKTFTEKDDGRYLIEYEWIRTDGRFARDAKMIMVQPKEHKVDIEVKNFDDESINEDSLQLSAVEFAGGETRPNTNFGTDTKSSLKTTVEHFKAVDLAFKNVNTNAKIKKIKFEITTKDSESDIKTQFVTIDPVQLDTEFSVPITYYYSSYEEGGKYFAKKVTTDRKYSLKRDATNDYFYLTMNNEFVDNETGFKRSDLESDVKVTIYVEDNEVVSKGGVTIINKTFDNDVETNVKDTISYVIKDNNGKEIERFDLDSKENNQKIIEKLEVGEYTIERTASSTYDLKDIIIDKNAPIISDVTKFNVVKNGDTQIVVRNIKKVVVPDPAPDPEQKPEPEISLPSDSEKESVDTGDRNGSRVGFYGTVLMASFVILMLMKSKYSKGI